MFLYFVFVSFTVAMCFLYHAHPPHTGRLAGLPILTTAGTSPITTANSRVGLDKVPGLRSGGAAGEPEEGQEASPRENQRPVQRS